MYPGLEKILLRRHFIRDGFNPFLNERPSFSIWPEASNTMRTLALGKLFPQLTMPLSPANLLDSSGDWLTPFFDVFCFFFFFFFFFPPSFIRMKPQPNCRNKMARKPNCISVVGYQTFERSKTCTHIGDSHAGELIYLSIQASICLTGIKVFGLFLIFFANRMFKWRTWYSIFVLCFLRLSKYNYFVTV